MLPGWGADDFERARRPRIAATPAGRDAADERRRTFLSEASELLASSLERQTTLEQVAQLAVPGVADWCAFYLCEDLERGRGAVAMAPRDPGGTDLARALARGTAEALQGPAEVLRTAHAALYPDVPEGLPRQLGVRSAMFVPMGARGRTVGVVAFLAARSGRRYGPDDLSMAGKLAHLAALAIDNARLYEQAQEAVRAREEVVAIVSHDLKNPLNAILMSAGLLRRSADDPERVRHHAEAIERAVARMRDLVRDLLDLARLEAGRFTLERAPEEMAPLVAEAVALFQPLAQAKAIALAREGAPEGAVASCDRARVLQVLSNLVGNALAFTPRGGHVTVRWRPAAAEVVTAVVDDGPGIPADEQQHVFERFWKARTAGQGTGLGLSIAKGIVDAHGGRIWVESCHGAGAAFVFTLPRGGATAERPPCPAGIPGPHDPAGLPRHGDAPARHESLAGVTSAPGRRG